MEIGASTTRSYQVNDDSPPSVNVKAPTSVDIVDSLFPDIHNNQFCVNNFNECANILDDLIADIMTIDNALNNRIISLQLGLTSATTALDNKIISL